MTKKRDLKTPQEKIMLRKEIFITFDTERTG